MTTNQIPLLTVHLFVSSKNSRDGLEEMLQRLDESGITVKQYRPDDALLDIHPKNPRVYVSLGKNGGIYNISYVTFSREKTVVTF